MTVDRKAAVDVLVKVAVAAMVFAAVWFGGKFLIGLL